MTAEDDLMLLGPLSFDCADCGAPEGDPCHLYAADIAPGFSHQDRRDKEFAEVERRFQEKDASTADRPAEKPVTGRKFKIRRASNIPMKRMRYLWKGRIPTGVLAVLAGKGGVGKSTLSDTLAAMVTNGDLAGEHHGTPRNVLVCASEDSWESMIVPRLAAAGADLSRILQLEVTEDDRPGRLSLPADLGAFEQVIRDQEVAMVVLSPLVSQLGEKIDAHQQKDVRSALEPLAAIADRTGAAIVGIVHPNKGGSTDPYNLIGMSGAFQDTARVVLLAMEDPDDPEAAVLGVSKTNMGRKGMLIGYRIEEARLKVTDGWTEVPRVLWGDDRPGLVEDVLRALKRKQDGRTTKTDEAVDWLMPYLLTHGGAAFHDAIMADGEAAGYEADTLRRARKSRGIVTRRTPWTPSSTVWVMPDPSGDRTGEVRETPGPVTPIDPESARGYDGPGQVVGPDARGRYLVIDWGARDREGQ